MMWCKAPGRKLLQSAAALAAVLALGACEFPTAAPVFDTRFVIPSETTTLSVTQLLPSSIQVVNSAFQLALTPATLNRTLASLCSCVVPAGVPVPYPGFTSTVSTQITIPSDVVSATLASGAVNVAVSNTFGFDPLQPPGFAGTGGTMTVSVVNNGRTLGSTVITGPFPTGTTKNATITLAPGNLQGPIDIAIAITSPPSGAGQTVTANGSGSLNVTATPSAISISSANVAVSNKAITVNAIDLNLKDIDQDIASHAKSGAIILKMVNPFTVGGTLSLKITGGSAGTITKTVTVAAGTTSQRVEFTESEIQSILGHQVQLSITGPVSGTGAGSTATVTPTQVLNIDTSLDLVIRVGTVK